jgi:DNA-binding transcriptional ArsR family regulator
MDAHLMKELELLYDQAVCALGDPKRLIILYALQEKSCCVNKLAAELGMPQPTISRHLKILREHELVKTVRTNTTICYSLCDDRLMQALELLRSMLRDRLREQANLIMRDTGPDA